jgi:hypothetical protein
VIGEVRPGLKRWAGPHPEFDPTEGDLDDSYTDVEVVVPAHGEPVLENGREALACALEA